MEEYFALSQKYSETRSMLSSLVSALMKHVATPNVHDVLLKLESSGLVQTPLIA